MGVPFCISNMPGEERWRLLNLEPTRALGHRNNKEPPLRHPEVYEWQVPQAEDHMLLVCCDGFFSKNAFPSPEHVTRFLADPVPFCKSKTFPGDVSGGAHGGDGPVPPLTGPVQGVDGRAF